MKRCVLSIVVLFALVPFALADDKPKPNTLTAKEIAEGWILLFDGETTFGWTVEGQSAVKDGVWRLGGGPKIAKARFNTTFAEYEAIVEVDGSQGVGDLVLVAGTSGIPGQPAVYEITSRIRDGDTMSGRLTVGPDKVAREKVEAWALTPKALAITAHANGALKIKSVKIRPVGLAPLFNRKDLTGWKVTQFDPKRVATKFEVTKDGELSAKNGPGDLQTDKQFDDFILQLECKTNGKFLNSGLFFRCMPDAYQNGYEAQIQNGYLLDDRTKPIDYGTGAIYRRVAARKVVSNDNEWFTMTVAARGAHIATWVNGYQTVDWTDDRKANDNPRQGLRTAKGHLSIQGHDPTTDLLFRNIRIVELPKP
jgi:hypothetical protein